MSRAAWFSRSRSQSRSRNGLGRHTRRGLLDPCQRAMPLGHAELDAAHALDTRARDLGFAVLEAIGHDHLDAVLGTGRRIADGLAFRLENTGYRYARRATVHVELEGDRGEDGIEHLRHDQAEDMENRAFGRVLAGEDLEQGITLPRGGALVDDCLHCSVALVERAGEVDHDEEAEAIELCITEVTLLDAHAEQAFAVSVRRASVEVARTTERAVAVLDPIAMKAPVGLLHRSLPPI